MSDQYMKNELFDNILSLSELGEWEEVKHIVNLNSAIVTKKDETGRFLLAEIARFPYSKDVIGRLVELGADVDGTTWNGTRAIANAIIGGTRHGANTLDEVKILVSLGASLTARTESGFPPLHWAIVNCRPEHIKLLLELGANPNQGSNDSPPETAYDVAQRMQYQEALELLDTHKLQ